jgi:hypothetical protein
MAGAGSARGRRPDVAAASESSDDVTVAWKRGAKLLHPPPEAMPTDRQTD